VNTAHSFPYEAWPPTGNSRASHYSGVQTPSAEGYSLAVVRDVYVLNSSVQCSVAAFYRLAIVSLARTTSFCCENTWQHMKFFSAWSKPVEKYTRSSRPTLFHSVLLIAFRQSFMRKGFCQYRHPLLPFSSQNYMQLW
jgi:hypothetical protein